MIVGEAPNPEFSRPVDVSRIGDGHRRIEASEAERAALARRFGLNRIDRLEAELDLSLEGSSLRVTGSLLADLVQSCAVTGDDLAVQVDEPLAIRFVPAAEHAAADEEIELSEEDCDEIEFEGSQVDLGEAVAQSLALSIDPFATGPGADEARKAAGIVDESAAGPFAALAALKKDR